jgi:hypothetical protein
VALNEAELSNGREGDSVSGGERDRVGSGVGGEQLTRRIQTGKLIQRSSDEGLDKTKFPNSDITKSIGRGKEERQFKTMKKPRPFDVRPKSAELEQKKHPKTVTFVLLMNKVPLASEFEMKLQSLTERVIVAELTSIPSTPVQFITLQYSIFREHALET